MTVFVDFALVALWGVEAAALFEAIYTSQWVFAVILVVLALPTSIYLDYLFFWKKGKS